MTKAKADAVSGGGKHGGRFTPLPLPTVCEVAMKDVPEPPLRDARDKYAFLWAKVQALGGDRAVCAAFTEERQAKAVRAKFRKLAKAAGKFLSTSHSSDGLTWYFWLEKLR